MLEKEINQVQEMRLLLMVEPFLLPLLDKNHKQILSTIFYKHAEGKTDFVAEVAKLALIQDLKNQLESVKVNGNRAYQKIEELEDNKEE